MIYCQLSVAQCSSYKLECIKEQAVSSDSDSTLRMLYNQMSCHELSTLMENIAQYVRHVIIIITPMSMTRILNFHD